MNIPPPSARTIPANAVSTDTVRYLANNVGSILSAKVQSVRESAGASVAASEKKQFDVLLKVGQNTQIRIKTSVAPRQGQILELNVLNSREVAIVVPQQPAVSNKGSETAVSTASNNNTLQQTPANTGQQLNRQSNTLTPPSGQP